MQLRTLPRVLVLLLVLALALTACQPTAPKGPDAEGGSEIDAIDLTGKNIEVVLWHNRSQSDQDLLQEMLDEFNASNPYGITARAEIGGASYNDVYNKINAAIQGGTPPNIAVAYQNQAALYRSQDAVIDLTPYINSTKYGLSAEDRADYFQAFLDSDANPQFQGEVLGFPTQRSLEVMYYNQDWLTELGYDAPPTTWEEFEEIACKAAQEDDKAGWALLHEASNFASQVFARGGRILSEDGTRYVFNEQAGQDALAMIQRMAANKCLVEIPVSERYGEQNRFVNGDILFVFASSSGMNYYADAVAKAGGFKWAVAPLPQSGELHMNLYGASMSVFKTTPEQQLASWLVIKFLGEKEQTTRWAAKTGYLPVRASAKDDVIAALKANEKWASAADSYAMLFDWANAGMVESPVAGYDGVRALIDTDLISKVINDPNADVKALLDAAVVKADEILKENAPQ